MLKGMALLGGILRYGGWLVLGILIGHVLTVELEWLSNSASKLSLIESISGILTPIVLFVVGYYINFKADQRQAIESKEADRRQVNASMLETRVSHIWKIKESVRLFKPFNTLICTPGKDYEYAINLSTLKKEDYPELINTLKDAQPYFPNNEALFTRAIELIQASPINRGLHSEQEEMVSITPELYEFFGYFDDQLNQLIKSYIPQ